MQSTSDATASDRPTSGLGTEADDDVPHAGLPLSAPPMCDYPVRPSR